MITASALPPRATDPLRDAMAAMASALLVCDDRARVRFANREATAMFGCGEAPMLPLSELLEAAGACGQIAWPAEMPEDASGLTVLGDGRVLRYRARAVAEGGAVIVLDDVSSFVRDTEQALRDPLTGLANRAHLNARLAALVADGGALAVFALDLDRFKQVNDTLGHPVGDALLRTVGERLVALMGGDGLVARIGGDEFIVVSQAAPFRDDAAALATRMADIVGRAYALEGHLLNIGTCVGVALFPDDADDAASLLRHADLALYCAKAEGIGNTRLFEPAMKARMDARRALEIDLRRAMALREFRLVYQPQVNLESGEIVGFEALIRWHHATRGMVSPADFIPLAEEIGLIVPIGEWVLRTACREAAGWDRPVSVAVNLSPLQFRNARLVGSVVSALASAGLAAERLELEITEGALMDDTDKVVGALGQLRSLGVKVSMDDFGTGYSSLSYLQKFPFDKIKIDQSFVRTMGENEEAVAIVRAIAGLGASLGMKTTAEGVETAEQLAAIRAEGCSEVQGFLTGRPMDAAAAATLVQDRCKARIEA